MGARAAAPVAYGPGRGQGQGRSSVARWARQRAIIPCISLCRNSKNAAVSVIRTPAGVSSPRPAAPSRRVFSNRVSTWSRRVNVSYQSS